MRMRTTLAALAAVAMLSLTACGNDDTGGSAEPAGDSPVATAENTDGGETGMGDTATDSDETDMGDTATDGGDSGSEDGLGSEGGGSEGGSGGSEGGMGGVGAEGCLAVADILKEFSSAVMQKVTSGGLTQADVDAVFTEERMSQVPEELAEDVNNLKDIATQMVGKDPQELAGQAQDLQKAMTEIATNVKDVCAGG